MQNQLTGAEAGLMLFASLTGEAEAESEHMSLAKVNSKEGVEYIISCLKGPLEQKVLYQKRSLLAAYETVARTEPRRNQFDSTSTGTRGSSEIFRRLGFQQVQCMIQKAAATDFWSVASLSHRCHDWC